MTGIPVFTLAATVKEPPKTDCVVAKSGATSMASVMIPLLMRTASRPAISLPRAVEGINTAAGVFVSTI